MQVPDLAKFKVSLLKVYLWNSTEVSSLERLWLKTYMRHVESTGCRFNHVSNVYNVAVTGSYRIRLVFKLISTLETGFAFHFSLFRTQVPKSTSERVCEMYELVIHFIYKYFYGFDLRFFTCYVKFKHLILVFLILV